jgi:glycosyltransferase involved in cell wall biosynthesis
MKISFCIICYNEERLIKRQLTNLYKHAFEIIVVEGRVKEFGDKWPKQRDKTLELVKSFPDPENKIQLITKTWSSKENMVQAYAKAATGDYLWHIDCDEFYTDDCIQNTKKFIADTQKYNYYHHELFYYRYYNTAIAKDGSRFFWNHPCRIHKAGGRLTHRPQLRHGHGAETAIPRAIGIRHHYSVVDFKKVREKGAFYNQQRHSKYYPLFDKPLDEIIEKDICVRPDNDKRENSFVRVLPPDMLEVPPGIDKIFSFYQHEKWPHTVEHAKQIGK